MRRLTDAEVLARYGDPAPYLEGGFGEPDLRWKAHILDGFKLPAPLPLSWDHSKHATSIACHRAVKLELHDIFNAIYANKEAWASIGDYGGCYLWRTNRNNPKVLSRHSWGLAVDLDVADNPNGSAEGMMHPFIVKTFFEHGWVWGGDKKMFPTPDRMHFEKGVTVA